jgi:hypothetical protein
MTVLIPLLRVSDSLSSYYLIRCSLDEIDTIVASIK